MAGSVNPAALTRIEEEDFVVRIGAGYSTADFDIDAGGLGGGSIETDGPVVIPAIYYAMSVHED
jgi:hypothetical protein